MMRAIHVIPDTRRMPGIEDFRRRFDFLYEHIRSHITLVFPFDLPVSDGDLIQHCQCVVGDIPAFSVMLHSPHRSEDDHLWLPVGTSELLDKLARRLHSGPLASLLPTRRTGSHHLTIGRPPIRWTTHAEIDGLQIPFPVALEVTSVTLEAIQPDQRSLVVGHFPLRE